MTHGKSQDVSNKTQMETMLLLIRVTSNYYLLTKY